MIGKPSFVNSPSLVMKQALSCRGLWKGFIWQVLVEMYKVAGKCFIILCTSLAAPEQH